MTSTGAEPLDRLLDAVSHELKTPLAAIVGYAELLRTRDDEAIRLEGPARIQEAAERLAATIDELAAVMAVDYAARLQPVAIDLGEVVAEAVELLRARGEDRVYVDRPEGVLVSAGRGELGRILAHLVAHARRASPAEGRIHIGAERRGGFAVVFVGAEAGPVKEVETIALAVARCLVELHGGSLSLENGGARLAFTLPLADGEPA